MGELNTPTSGNADLPTGPRDVSDSSEPSIVSTSGFPGLAGQSHISWFEALEAAEMPKAGPDLLIALDIDGTILHYDQTVSPRVREAIQAHAVAGTHVTIATGRSIPAADLVLDKLGLGSGFSVTSNGAAVITLGDTSDEYETSALPPILRQSEVPARLWRSHTFDPTHEIDVITEAIPEALIAVETLSGPAKINAVFPEGEFWQAFEIVGRNELTDPASTRVTVRVPTMGPQELLDVVNGLGLHGIDYFIGWSAWLDLAPDGVSKASGLEEVRNATGVSATHTIAMGDAGNDVDMLGWAGLGFAMGNAAPDVQARANAVIPTIYDDGVAQVLEALL